MLNAAKLSADSFREGDWITGIGAGIGSFLNAVTSVATLGGADIANAMGMKGWWGRDNDLIQADSEAVGRAKVEQRAMAPEVMAGAMEKAFAAMRKGDGTTATGMDAFEQALGGAENLKVIADLLGMEADVLRRKFKEQADELEPIIKAQKEFEEAQRAMARSTRAAILEMQGL